MGHPCQVPACIVCLSAVRGARARKASKAEAGTGTVSLPQDFSSISIISYGRELTLSTIHIPAGLGHLFSIFLKVRATLIARLSRVLLHNNNGGSTGRVPLLGMEGWHFWLAVPIHFCAVSLTYVRKQSRLLYWRSRNNMQCPS